jgi:hypothetical protein
MGGTSTTYPQVGTGQTVNSQGLYGRKYSLQVLTPQSDGSTTVFTVSDSSFEPEALRITFDVRTLVFQNAYWFADIDIYNLGPATSIGLIKDAYAVKPGMNVILSAGYQNGNYGIIWQGPILQPTWTRENVTDYRLTLHCIIGLLQAINGQTLSAVYSGFNQAQIVTSMIESLGLHLETPLPSKLSDTQLKYDSVVAGNPAQVLDEITKANDLVWFMKQRGLAATDTGIYVGDPAEGVDTATSDFTFTPSNGLLGTPVQNQNGVDFSVLLNPFVVTKLPLQVVSIDQALIEQIPYQPNAAGYPPYPLSPPLKYAVLQVRHRGDSRGDLWQTDIKGAVNQGALITKLIGSSQ